MLKEDVTQKDPDDDGKCISISLGAELRQARYSGSSRTRALVWLFMCGLFSDAVSSSGDIVTACGTGRAQRKSGAVLVFVWKACIKS